MICGSYSYQLRKVSTFVLLLALLGASLHFFAHLGDTVNTSAQTISGSAPDDETSGGASFSSNHTCLACQSLQHLSAKASAAFVLLIDNDRAGVDRHRLPTHTDALSGTAPSRAPPLV
ncbi:MAG: hypothetical protein U0Z53_20465 [Blastocatellia bacterium]